MDFECRVVEDQAYIRTVNMPQTVKGYTVPNDDGSYSVYINSEIPSCEQRAALAHELNHIESEHFYTSGDIAVKEAEAEIRM